MNEDSRADGPAVTGKLLLKFICLSYIVSDVQHLHKGLQIKQDIAR